MTIKIPLKATSQSIKLIHPFHLIDIPGKLSTYVRRSKRSTETVLFLLHFRQVMTYILCRVESLVYFLSEPKSTYCAEFCKQPVANIVHIHPGRLISQFPTKSDRIQTLYPTFCTVSVFVLQDSRCCVLAQFAMLWIFRISVGNMSFFMLGFVGNNDKPLEYFLPSFILGFCISLIICLVAPPHVSLVPNLLCRQDQIM